MHRIVDVSNNNGAHLNFAAIRAAGAVGVWIKATEGTGFLDPDYASNRRRAKAAGLRVGAYHFGHPGNHPGAEAALFLAHLELEPGDLLPALDIEVTDGQPAHVVAAYAAGFLEAVRGKIRAHPLLYSGSYFIRDNRLEQLPGGRWIPSYGAPPALYTWAAWQKSDGSARYPGAVLSLDTSVTRSLALVTYRAHPAKRLAGRAYVTIDGFRLRVGSTLYRWVRRNRKALEGRRPA